jgi:hypothetical protein
VTLTRNICASVAILVGTKFPYLTGREFVRWLSLETSELKTADAEGVTTHVCNAGNIIPELSGTGDGIFGDLMMHLYSISVRFVILI